MDVETGALTFWVFGYIGFGVNTGGGNFANGQTVVVFSVPTVGPQTQSKTTTITYKLRLTGTGVDPAADALLPSVSAALTVNP